MIETNGLELTDDERVAAERIAERLNAEVMSLYRTSEGLFAFVRERGGAEHNGVPVQYA